MSAIDSADTTERGPNEVDGEYCFICTTNSKLHELTSGQHRKSPGKGSTLNLDSQLSVILLLRKVLGIHQNLLTRYLESAGNPCSWGIKLCAACLTVFREIEFVHGRLLKYHADFEDLANELRSLLAVSVASEEIKGPSPPTASSLPQTAKRRPGRPLKRARKRILDTPAVDANNVVQILRRAYIEGKNAGTLDLSFPRVLFRCQSTGTELDDTLTTQVVSVQLPGKSLSPTIIHIRKLTETDETDSRRKTDSDWTANGAACSSTRKLKTSETAWSPKVVLKKLECIPDPHVQGTSAEIADYGPITELQSNVEVPCFNSSGEELAEDNKLVEKAVSLRHDLSIKEECLQSDEDSNYGVYSERDEPQSPEWLPEDANNALVEDCKIDETGDQCHSLNTLNVKQKTAYVIRKKTMKAQRKVFAVSREKLDKNTIGTIREPTLERDRFKCPDCDKSFKKKLDCRVHQLRDHYGDPLPYHCHVCDASRYSQEVSFRRHMKRFHTGAKSPYDSDYDPARHSVESLKSLVEEDIAWKSLTGNEGEIGTRNRDEADGTIAGREFPEELLQQFRNDPDKTYSCRQCTRKFSSVMMRDGHEKRQHQGIKEPFECQLCHRKYIRRTKLLQHLYVVHYSSQHVCSQCGGRFADKILLEGHIRRAHLGERLPFICTVKDCGRRFLRKCKMDAHIRKNHGLKIASSRKRIPVRLIKVPSITKLAAVEVQDRTDDLECWMCSSGGNPIKFKNHKEKDEHMDNIHRSIPKAFQCPAEDCGKRYASNSKLDHHISTFHKDLVEESEEYACDECDEKFPKKYLLENHLIKHEKSPFVCDLCGKQFKMQMYLDDHQHQRHHKELNIEPHKCKICGKILSTARSLQYHTKLKHTKETKYKCKECDYGCMFEKALQVHMEIKHLKVANALCPICSRPFPNQHYLTRHMRIHTGEKPYECNECGKRFSDNPTYNRHVEAHKGRIHECPLGICKKQYKTRHAFRVHIKQHQRKGIKIEIPAFNYEDDDNSSDNRHGIRNELEIMAESSSSCNDLSETQAEVADHVKTDFQEVSAFSRSTDYECESAHDPNQVNEPPVLHDETKLSYTNQFLDSDTF